MYPLEHCEMIFTVADEHRIPVKVVGGFVGFAGSPYYLHLEFLANDLHDYTLLIWLAAGRYVRGMIYSEIGF